MVREDLRMSRIVTPASRRKRHQGQRCAGRLDQLRGASVGHRRAARRRIGTGRLRPLGQPHAALGQPNALGRISDGGLLLRRGFARRDPRG